MLATEVDAVIGVDTHRDTHTAALVHPTGASIATTVISTDPAGFHQLLDFVTVHAPGPRLVWAIEGTRSYGVGLVRFLQRHGQSVVEIDHPKRRARRRGKSDQLDAVGAAREALARSAQSHPRADGPREGLRVLLLARDTAVSARTAAINTLKALILTAPDELRSQLRGRPALAQARRCAALRSSGRRSRPDHALMLAMRSTGRRILALNADATELERELHAQVRTLAPSLLEEPGVGPTVAAQLLVAWSHRGRLHSEAAFARLAGVAPLEASSGQTTRHRLSRTGDRAVNRALHMAVLSRLAHDAQTQAYQNRRLGEGKSKAEIRRCLKRHLARHLFRVMQALPDGT
jgi:transposase